MPEIATKVAATAAATTKATAAAGPPVHRTQRGRKRAYSCERAKLRKQLYVDGSAHGIKTKSWLVIPGKIIETVSSQPAKFAFTQIASPGLYLQRREISRNQNSKTSTRNLRGILVCSA